MENLERTQEEQAEYVKSLIKRYWLLALIVIIGSIGSVYGINKFKQDKLDKLNQEAVSQKVIDVNLENNQIDMANKVFKELSESKTKSSQSIIAAFKLAKKYFEIKEYDKAIEKYDWLIDYQQGNKIINDIAKIRKAKVLSMKNEEGAAIQLLSTIHSDSTRREVALLKGDIYLSINEYDNAIKSYQVIENEAIFQQRIQLAKIKQQENTIND